MFKYIWVARASVVAFASLVIFHGVLPNSPFFGPDGHYLTSTDLLNDARSPLRALDQQSIGDPEETVALSNKSIQQPLIRTFAHTIKRGDTLSSVWREIGGRAEELEQLIQVLKSSGVTPGALKLGEQLSVTHSDGNVVELRKRLSSGATVVLARDEQGALVSRVDRVKVVSKEKRVTGTILSSMVDSASGLSLPYSLVDDFVDLFSNRVEFNRDIQPGDSFTIIFDERVSADGEKLAPGAIKGASLQLSGKLLAVVRDVAPDGTVRYFDEKGQMPTKAFLRYPVKYSRISSVFTQARFHPVLKISRPHHGVDFSAPVGTPVRSVGDGVVVAAGYGSSTGNMVRIAHGSRYTTEYFHLNSIASGVQKGARIGRGESIGTVGKTGLASGPHLHFGLFDRGKYIDPMKAKVTEASDPVRPPAAVMVMVEDLKKAHQAVAVASKDIGKKA